MMKDNGHEYRSDYQSGFTVVIAVALLVIVSLTIGAVFATVNSNNRLHSSSESSESVADEPRALSEATMNSHLKSITARIATEMSNYAGNNNGRVPASSSDVDDMYSRYIKAENVDIGHPATGVQMKIEYIQASEGQLPAPGQGIVGYSSGFTCAKQGIASLSTSRAFILWTQLEGGDIHCIDNV